MELDYGEYKALIEEKKKALFTNASQYLSKKQREIIHLAFTVASYAHFGQNRKSGEPYITHPIEVATIIAKWQLDEQTIAGSLLHDVVEDTNVSKADLTQVFGKNIADLVDGVTKLEKLHFESEEIAHAEYFRKVVLAMAKDIRVILIKLADRLHNMLTLNAMRKEKRVRIAKETMEIYVPIANKLGLHKVHSELSEESFKNIYPLRYLVLSKATESAQKKRLPIIEEILSNINNALKANGLKAEITYKKRSIYNVYRRMRRTGLNFDSIYNVFEIKIIVEKIRDCYLTLGVLHNLYQPLPAKFKDHIAIPKNNGYQSLHSTLMGPKGTPLELHIRTHKMDEVAENGIISHWLKHKNEEEFFSAQERTKSWLNNILDIQSGSFSANDFLSSIKKDLFPKDIYVFTPHGKIILMPFGSTPIDFAYYVHTKIGNHCYKAKINQRPVKLNTKLRNGDIVEIITKKEAEPSERWLSAVVSGRAISHIKKYLKEQKYDDDVNNGMNLITSNIDIFAPQITNIEDSLNDYINLHFSKLSLEEFKHQIGNGTLSVLAYIKHVLQIPISSPLTINLSQCPIKIIQDERCLALPGDKIFAKITRYNELAIHKARCKQLRNDPSSIYTLVDIVNDTVKGFAAEIETLILDEPGVFNKVSALIAEQKINIIELTQSAYSSKFARIRATLGVKSRNHINELIDSLKQHSFIGKVESLS